MGMGCSPPSHCAACAVPGSIPLGENVALKSAAGVLAGANAVCHFLARSANALDSTSLKVDEWVEFEAAALAPAVATIAAGQSNDVVRAAPCRGCQCACPFTCAPCLCEQTISALNTAFGRLEGALAAGGPYVTGVRWRCGEHAIAIHADAGVLPTFQAALTLADVVLYGSVDAVFTKNTIAGTEFPAVAAWHASFGGNGAAQAASKLANGLVRCVPFLYRAPHVEGRVASPVCVAGTRPSALPVVLPPLLPAAASSCGCSRPSPRPSWRPSHRRRAYSPCLARRVLPACATHASSVCRSKMNMKAKVGPAGSANKFKHHYQCNSVMQVAARLKIKDRVGCANVRHPRVLQCYAAPPSCLCCFCARLPRRKSSPPSRLLMLWNAWRP